MDRVLDKGKSEGWTQDQYKRALEKVIQKERRALKSGERKLNEAKDFRK